MRDRSNVRYAGSEDEAGGAAIPMEVESHHSPLVLIVDDHSEGRDMCSMLLLQAGFRVATAINGLDGLVRAMSDRPDVILMDLAMPDLDGWDCIRQLGLVPSTREIPIVMVTAHATPEVRALAAAAGCRSCLAKPFSPPSLIAEIHRLTRSPGVELPGSR